jgi:BirA family biotin operon repressor/biotin-[acetyl-CoA-carboxylase] ligase
MIDQVASEFVSRPRAGVIGRRVLYYPSLSSTMDVAKKLAWEGATEGTVVLAGEQTGGRGRMGRTWISPPGTSISFSVILHPGSPHLGQLNMLVSLAVCRGIEEVTGLTPRVKWPNDILIGRRKVSGILIENVFEGDRLVAAIVGIGINLDLDPTAFPEISGIATSLSAEARRQISYSDTLTSVLDALERTYDDLRAGRDIYQKWLPLVETIGQIVQVKYGESIVEGVAESVDTEGHLVLRTSDGRHMKMVAGEVTLQTG